MSIYNNDDFYLLSKIVWVKAEKNCKGKTSFIFVPFFVYKNFTSTFAKNILNNINYCKNKDLTIKEYLTNVCKREYNINKNCDIMTVDFKNNSITPQIFDIEIPKKLTLDPKKEYFNTGDILLSTTEIRNLSKYFSKKEQQKAHKIAIEK